MINVIEQYVDNLDDSEKVLIINGYEALTTDGFIGDDPIRLHAKAVIEQMGFGESNIMLWMNQLAFECYRNFGKRYIYCKSLT